MQREVNQMIDSFSLQGEVVAKWSNRANYPLCPSIVGQSSAGSIGKFADIRAAKKVNFGRLLQHLVRKEKQMYPCLAFDLRAAQMNGPAHLRDV